MKKVRISFAMIAMVLGVSAAFATQSKRLTAERYAKVPTSVSSTGWINVNSLIEDNDEDPAPNTYSCDEAESICTGLFNSAPSSPGDVPNGGSAVQGEYRSH